MQTIIIKLDAEKLSNPDLDIRYQLPDYMEKYTDGQVTDNGYDYISNTELGIWLQAEDAAAQVQKVIQCLKDKRFMGNDLSRTAKVYISEQESAELDLCKEVSYEGNPAQKDLPDYVKVLIMEEANLAEVYFSIEMQKPFSVGEKMNEINEQAYMNGYNWEAFLAFYLERNYPALLEEMETDPEAGTYVAFYKKTPENIEKARQFAELIAYLIEDEEDLYEIVREMGDEIEWD